MKSSLWCESTSVLPIMNNSTVTLRAPVTCMYHRPLSNADILLQDIIPTAGGEQWRQKPNLPQWLRLCFVMSLQWNKHKFRLRNLPYTVMVDLSSSPITTTAMIIKSVVMVSSALWMLITSIKDFEDTQGFQFSQWKAFRTVMRLLFASAAPLNSLLLLNEVHPVTLYCKGFIGPAKF